MKSYKLKKSSWHYKIANFGGQRVFDSTNICDYSRSVLIGGISFLFVTTLVTLLLSITAYAISNIIGWLFFDYILGDIAKGFITVIIAGLAGMLPGLFYIYFKEKVETTEPGFTRLAYRKFKEKTCSLVEFQ